MSSKNCIIYIGVFDMNRIKELREEKKLTQQELADKLDTTKKNVYRWENEITEISSSSLIRLADFFEVTIDYLIYRENDLGIVEVNNKLTTNENKLLNMFRKLDHDGQLQLFRFIEAYTSM